MPTRRRLFRRRNRATGRTTHLEGARRKKVFECPVEICAECGGNLHVSYSKKAHVYGFHPTIEVRQVNKRCGKMRCRTRHWYDYRLVIGEQKYFEDGGVGGVISTNPSVGFDVTFLRYVQKLLFYAYDSFAAVAKSPAATIGSSTGNRFQAHLAEGFFFLLLRALAEFREIKYDVRRITGGDEVAPYALQAYTKHLMQNVYPPRSVISVRAVVADGGAKVLHKCGKGEKHPLRIGSPLKRKDGSQMAPKPYWGGWFFFIPPHKSGRILNAVTMYRPGNNANVLNEMGRVVGGYP